MYGGVILYSNALYKMQVVKALHDAKLHVSFARKGAHENANLNVGMV